MPNRSSLMVSAPAANAAVGEQAEDADQGQQHRGHAIFQ